MHQEGYDRRIESRVVNVPSSEAFSGRELTRFVYAIRNVIRVTNARTILDYGSGKGKQYSEPLLRDGKKLSDSIHEFWNVREIDCYDPGIDTSLYPEKKKFDGVVATHVVDHIPEEDVKWVINRLFSHANKFVFCNVANFQASTWLPNGENARVTRKSKFWWSRLFSQMGREYPKQYYCVAVAEAKTDSNGDPKFSTSYIHNVPGLILPGQKSKMTGLIKENQ